MREAQRGGNPVCCPPPLSRNHLGVGSLRDKDKRMNEELLETWRHSHSLWLSRTWGLLALEAVQAHAALGEGAGSMDTARLCWRTGWRALDQHRIGRWPQGWAEFTAGMVVLSQETPGPGTVQERASCSEWQPPLWERRSQQVCRGLFLTKNAAVGKGSQALSGA